jgi:NAD(P)-dependent dehydrogenase (short-subunit alcohol dehydrogenase family)
MSSKSPQQINPSLVSADNCDTVLITGTSRGIGAELAQFYLEKNCRVIATVRSLSRADELRSKVKTPPTDKFKLLECDVSSEESIKKCFLEVKSLGWTIDVLINNAGHMDKSYKNENVLNADPKVMMKTYQVNVIGPMLMVRHFLPLMTQSKFPRIIFVSSTAGSHTVQKPDHARGPSYNASKAALNMIGVRLAFDLRQEKEYQKFIVTLIHPGWVKTEMGYYDPAAPAAGPVVEPRDAAASLFLTICKIKGQEEFNGKFVDRDGKPLPW